MHARGWAWCRLLLCCVLGPLVCGPTALADPFHSQTLPLGQRAIGMGGAFVAVADDPSATYYNPAGVAWASDGTLSASLTLTAFDRSTVESGYRTSVGESALNHSTAASLPVFVSASKHIGKRDAEGRRRHGVALSSFTVSQRRLDFDAEVRSRGPSGTEAIETLSIEQSERTLWYGFSYAYRALPSLAFGLSSYVSVSRSHYGEERIGAALGAVNPDGSFVADRTTWTSHLTDTNVKSFMFRIGGLYAFDERLRLGMMFQPPSVHIRGRARVRERYLRSDRTTDEDGTFFNASQKDLGAASPLPWELRTGARYLLRHWLVIAADVSLYGRSGSKRDPVVAIGPRSPDPETGAVARLGAFLPERWYRTYNGNVSLGMAATLREIFELRCGLYTDFSSAPRVPRYTSTYQAPHVHRVGGSVSIGLVSDGYDFSLGLVGIYGRGHALSFNDDATGDMYQRTHATDRMFIVFLNGVRNAVRTLASKANEQLQRMRPATEGAARTR